MDLKKNKKQKMTEDNKDIFPVVLDDNPALANPRLTQLVEGVLAELGEDVQRQGLVKTPARVARALEFMTSGYRLDPKDVINAALFDCTNDEMVIERDISFFSMCEHHLLPFYGVCHVAYLPSGKVVGISKIARIVDLFARRLQIQERMTREIAECLNEHLKPKGVAVVVEAFHMCMAMRGVQKQNAKTITSAMLGGFKSDIRTRTEFLSLINGQSLGKFL